MPYFAITQRVVSKHHHSLTFCKLRLLQQGVSFETHVLSKYVFSFKNEQFLLVHAVGRIETGGYSGAHAASEVHREKGCQRCRARDKKQRRHFFVGRTT